MAYKMEYGMGSPIVSSTKNVKRKGKVGIKKLLLVCIIVALIVLCATTDIFIPGDKEITKAASANYVEPDVGHWAAVGLISPINSVVSLFCSQIGSADAFYDVCVLTDKTFWGHMDLRIWFVLTIIVQLGLAFLALLLASKRLNPIKKVKKK